MSLAAQITRRSRAFLRSPLLQPLTDEAAINDVLAVANPLWSLNEIHARVEQRIDEAADTMTFVLAPNRLWPGHRAGQHVMITVEIDGVRHQRSFTLSSRPGDAPALTIKRCGRVTQWLHESAVAGTRVTLSAPRGEFVLPDAVPSKLLLIGAGSGVTPVMSMLRDLDARNLIPDLTFVHVSRNSGDAIFEAELRAIAARRSNLKLVEVRTDVDGLPTGAALARLVPDFAQRETFLCGPPPFMAVVEDLFRGNGAAERVRTERFGAPVAKASGGQAQVSGTRSGRAFAADTGLALLPQAEAAGLNPKSGCRIGICMTCKCRKASGTVQNLLTGEISSEPGEMIQLCISAARSDLQLDL
jgi:ferredoxin-NADP reductase